MTLYRKYRPQTFAQVIGQPQVTEIVSRAIVAGQPAHAYLFAGPRGTGKTSVARIIAKSLNCLERADGSAEPCNHCEHCQAITRGSFLDVLELDAASNRGIDEIRQLKEQVALAPSLGKYKIYILDEAHMLTDAAFNALLKTLEEPPANVVFILCTTEAHKIPVTIASRCQRLSFARANSAQLVEQLREVAASEKVKIEDDALSLLASLADGGYRDAEMLLEQAIAMASPKTAITRSYLEEKLGLASQQVIDQLTNDLSSQDADQAIIHIESFVGKGGNVRQLVDALLDQFRQILLAPALKPEDVADGEQYQRLTDYSAALGKPRTILLIQALLKARQSLQHFQGVHQALALETAILEVLQPFPASPDNVSVASQSANAASKSTDQRKAADKTETASDRPATSKKADPAKPAAPKAHRTEPAADTESSAEQTSATHSSESADPTSNPNPNPPDQPADSGSESSISPQELTDLWSKILLAIRPKSRSVEALLRDCLPLSFDGTILVLQFWYVFHKNRLDLDKNRLLVEEAATEVIGRKIRIKTQLGDKSTRPKKKPMAEEDIHNVTDIEDSAEDNLVDAALEIFGGEIVE